MGVMMEAAYHMGVQGNYTSVPSPADGDHRVPYFYDYLAHEAQNIKGDAIDHVLIAPPFKAQGGNGRGCDGYGMFDDYDLGDKPQQNSTESRFGPFRNLIRMGAIFCANGLDLYIDLPLHQRAGGNNRTYRYWPDGEGRFPKFPSYFLGGPGGVARDPIAGPVEDDFGFGDELCPVNAKPKDQLARELVRAAKFAKKLLGYVGLRVDDTKGLAAEFVHRLLTSGEMNDLYAVGEYFDGQRNNLNWWNWNSGMNGRASTFDFGWRWPWQRLCNSGGSGDARSVIGAGLNEMDGMHAATFIDNHDTDLSFPCIWNKMMAYAGMASQVGKPCVFGRDYFQRDGCYGLRPWIANNNWVNKHLANGNMTWRWGDRAVVGWERLDHPGLLTLVNNDPWNWHTVTVQTNFGANVEVKDYAGHPQGYSSGGTLRTNDRWQLTAAVPPNRNGHGYVHYSRVGQDKPNPKSSRTAVNHFEFERGLGIQPIAPLTDSKLTDIWCEADTHYELRPEGNYPNVKFYLEDEDGNHLAGKTKRRGWHTIRADSTNPMPVSGEIRAEYQAPRQLELPIGWRSEFAAEPRVEDDQQVEAHRLMNERIAIRAQKLSRSMP